jgi:hypothetical protein
MEHFNVFVVISWITRCLSTIFTDIEFRSTDFVSEALLMSVNFALVRLETATLSECFVTLIAFERTNTRMRARVSFQIECIVESFATERAEISFELTMILQMSIEKTLQFECLPTETTH